MLTQKLIKSIIGLTLLTVLAFAMSGAALADGPDNGIDNATEFISYLDGLRDMGQAEAEITQARHIQEKAVFDFSSYLVSLREQAATPQTVANRPTIEDATAYTSHLEQLRAMGNPVQMDANAFATYLDELRQKGQDAARMTSPQVALP